MLEGILEELDAKKERRRLRQLADTDRQVPVNLFVRMHSGSFILRFREDNCGASGQD